MQIIMNINLIDDKFIIYLTKSYNLQKGNPLLSQYKR